MLKAVFFAFLTLDLCAGNYLFGQQFSNGGYNENDIRQPSLGFDPSSLGDQIRQSVHNQLQKSGVFSLGQRLSNLGASISSNVHQSLLPVYAMQIKNKMMNGVGGVTTVTYYGRNVRSMIIQNGARSVCYGTIEGSQCNGNLTPFTITSDEDFCYSDSYAILNNKVCLSTGPVNVAINNNIMQCNSNAGDRTLILDRAEYNQLCGADMRASYVYFSNPRDPNAVPIPNSNPYVNCVNQQPGVCAFEERKQLNGGSTQISNNYSFHYQSN